jgi:hypothetical protein
MADRSTHTLMGMDLGASFEAKRSVIVLTLPLGHLRVTAMATTERKGKKVWLAANYLYTRKTYVVDPEKALQKGSLLKAVENSYVNGAFPSGMAVWKGLVIEFDQTPLRGLIYAAALDRVTAGENLLEASTASFVPPTPDSLGPAVLGEDLVMLSPSGRLYRLPLKSAIP